MSDRIAAIFSKIIEQGTQHAQWDDREWQRLHDRAACEQAEAALGRAGAPAGNPFDELLDVPPSREEERPGRHRRCRRREYESREAWAGFLAARRRQFPARLPSGRRRACRWCAEWPPVRSGLVELVKSPCVGWICYQCAWSWPELAYPAREAAAVWGRYWRRRILQRGPLGIDFRDGCCASCR